MLNAITQVLGGLIFFAFGLQVITRAFERVSGVYLKVALNLLARNRFTGVLVGAVVSFLFASTSGATVLLVNMGDAGLLTLRQALAVTLGAAIGTTLTVQIIAFDIGDWSIYIIGAGFLLMTFGRYDRRRETGRAVFGVGLLFFGLLMMKGGVQSSVAAQGLSGMRQWLSAVSANPFYLFLLGIVATAVLQSSATTLAVAFAFGLSVPAAIPVALGASVGTTAAGLVSGIASKPIGRQIAIGHLLMKLLGAAFFMMILPYFTRSVAMWSARMNVHSPARIIANANTLYNVLNALIFLPLLPVVAEVVTSIAGRRRMPPVIEGLSLDDLDDAPRAVEKARAQVVKMGRTALEMLRQDLAAFIGGEHKVTDAILAGEDNLDTYDAVLSDFLARISEADLDAAANTRRSHLLYVVKDLEHVGDVLAHGPRPSGSKENPQGARLFHRGRPAVRAVSPDGGR